MKEVRILEARHIKAYKIYVQVEGELEKDQIHLDDDIDLEHLIKASDGVFKKLHKIKDFKKFKIRDGVLTWCDGTIDIAPETIYKLVHQRINKQVLVQARRILEELPSIPKALFIVGFELSQNKNVKNEENKIREEVLMEKVGLTSLYSTNKDNARWVLSFSKDILKEHIEIFFGKRASIGTQLLSTVRTYELDDNDKVKNMVHEFRSNAFNTLIDEGLIFYEQAIYLIKSTKQESLYKPGIKSSYEIKSYSSRHIELDKFWEQL